MFKYIMSMAESKRQIYDKLVDASDQINLRLAKIVLFSESEYVPHWKQEIFAFLHRVDRLKGSKTWPKEKMIMRALSTHDDTAEQYMLLAIDDESDLAVSAATTVSDIEQAFLRYHAWLAKELSTSGMITRRSAYEELDSICSLGGYCFVKASDVPDDTKEYLAKAIKLYNRNQKYRLNFNKEGIVDHE